VGDDEASVKSGGGRRFGARFATAFAIAFGAAFLPVAAALAHLLRQADFPVLGVEAALAAAAVALGAAVFALLHAAGFALLRALLEGLLAALAIDLVFSSANLAFAGGFAILVFVAISRRSVLPAAAMMGAVMLATTLVGLGGSRDWIESAQGPGPPAPAAGRARPAVLHLILDEQIGIAGLPAANPEAAALADELRAFFRRRGFALYARAYSQHLHTVNAVPHILNFGVPTGAPHSEDGIRVGRTAWLEALARRGYRMRLYQSDFARFCADARYAECHTYAYTALGPIRALDITAAERARMILLRLFAQSKIVAQLDLQYRLARYLSGRPAPALDLSQRSRTSSIVSLAVFDRLRDDLRRARPGDAFVAHLLVPHFPYVVDRDCRFLPRRQWGSRISLRPRRAREAAYFGQVRCTMRKLDAALRALAASPAGRDAIVIVHGDHGSKIVRRYPDAGNVGRFGDADLVAGFSTLFAVRAPGIEPAYVEAPAPVAALLRDFERSGLRAAPAPAAPAAPYVFLDDKDWNPVRRVPFAPDW